MASMSAAVAAAGGRGGGYADSVGSATSYRLESRRGSINRSSQHETSVSSSVSSMDETLKDLGMLQVTKRQRLKPSRP